MLKIDIHTHILPKTWPDLSEKFGYGGFVRLDHCSSCSARMMVDDKAFREVQSNCWDPKVRIDECDACNVDVQALSTVPVMFAYWAKPRDTLEIARMLNDHLAGVVNDFPDRFVGLGTIPMQAPDLACEELERCVKDLGLHGVQIGTHVNGWNLDDEKLFPVFELAAKLGAAVFVHPWDMLARERMQQYWLSWLVGMPAETTLAICSMIFGGVLERLPDLRVCFAHGAGSFPGTCGRIKHGFDVRPDLCAVNNERDPMDYMGRFWADSLVHDESCLKRLVQLIGAERVCLGSDYPFPLGEHRPGELIESVAEFDERTRAMLLGGAAMEFLNTTEADLRGKGAGKVREARGAVR
ncbi:MAG: amidohydrolase family protein [Phycisphaerales bacterium]